MHLEAGLFARLSQSLEKIVVIALVQEDGLPLVSPAQDMVNRSGIFNAHLARHQPILPPSPQPRKPIKWTKLILLKNL
jgi:hypothetical protein